MRTDIASCIKILRAVRSCTYLITGINVNCCPCGKKALGILLSIDGICWWLLAIIILLLINFHCAKQILSGSYVIIRIHKYSILFLQELKGYFYHKTATVFLRNKLNPSSSGKSDQDIENLLLPTTKDLKNENMASIYEKREVLDLEQVDLLDCLRELALELEKGHYVWECCHCKCWREIKYCLTCPCRAIKSCLTSAWNGIKSCLTRLWNGICTCLDCCCRCLSCCCPCCCSSCCRCPRCNRYRCACHGVSCSEFSWA